MDLKVIFRRFFDKIYFQNSNCIGIGSGCTWFVLKNSISINSITYSGGVGKDISFEQDLANKYCSKVYLFDPSPTGLNTMKRIKNPNIFFFEKGLSNKTGEIVFQKPKNMKEGSWSHTESNEGDRFDCISLSDFFRLQKHKKIDLLKLDIEGFEYGVIEDLLSNNIFPKQICVEFHPFFNKKNKCLTKKTIKNLISKGYSLIYRDVYNYTFFLKDSS